MIMYILGNSVYFIQTHSQLIVFVICLRSHMHKNHRLYPGSMCGPVAQRIRHLTTNQGIPGSNPGRVVFFFLSLGFTFPFCFAF